MSLSAQEGRIADDRIEPAILARKHLRKLDLPMKRRERMRALLQGRGHGGELVPRRLELSRSSQLSTSARFFSRAFGLSSAKNAAITASPIRRMSFSRASNERCRCSWMARAVSSGAAWISARPFIASATRSFTSLPEQRQAGLRRVPMRRRDLRLRQPHQAVARFQRVIEEGELVVARERREPQRQLGEIGGERVLVDAVEAALRDEPAGVQVLVLVRRDRRPRLGPPRPSLHQPLAERAAGLDQEGARAHGRVADLEVQHVPRASRPARAARTPAPARAARSAR